MPDMIVYDRLLLLLNIRSEPRVALLMPCLSALREARGVLLSLATFAVLVGQAFFPVRLRAAEIAIANRQMAVHAGSDGTYTITAEGNLQAVLHARFAVEIDRRWVHSDEYPTHKLSEAEFRDTLGSGREATITSTGLTDTPDLVCKIRVYQNHPYGEIALDVQNHAAHTLQVQSVRLVEAVGQEILNLEGPPSSDRVLSDSFSEDWPPLRIYDLGKSPNRMHRAVGSQLIFNRQTKKSIFFGALSSDRLLTIFHLQTEPRSEGAAVAGFTVDSTGTTEIQATDEESGLREGPKENIVELSLPLAAGAVLRSERLMFSIASDYHAQLENYGDAIRDLHHSRITENNLLGWWSWTSYYTKITEGNTYTNALWLSEHLKNLGYDYFHFDLGYGYSRGEYATPNASQFPRGMHSLTQRVAQLGLNVGVWTAPFEVGERSSIYEQHKDWLVHNAKGEPIRITTAEETGTEPIFVLDTTNPGAQDFLRQTYRTLVREWGAKYIKLDFMDNTAIEGYYFRPNTTALEAQRIGLKVIRDAVGDDILLDKDGSPMLNPVGLVDEGRISQDTGHTFARSKEAAPGIAARYYMHRRFFWNDPDAFTVSRQLREEREIRAPLTLAEAQVSIALSAISGGLYEIGDDLPTLGQDQERVTLVENPDLVNMAKLGRAAVPLDLLTFASEDEQPSVFLLREDARQSIVAVFNWSEQAKHRRLLLSELGLPADRAYELHDVLDLRNHLAIENSLIAWEQPARSVRLIKLVDTSVATSPPLVKVRAPEHGKVSENLSFAAQVDPSGTPALNYLWMFGDGTSEQGRDLTHAYTMPGDYTVHLIVQGLDQVPAEKTVTVRISGSLDLPAPSRYRSGQ
jgi:hypothetical protein